MSEVLNTFDVYVQYANSEGFGMPQVEAASCGIPVMATDYSAMSDVVRKLSGFPIKVQRMYRERETHCWRALPDNDDFVRQLIELLSKPGEVRARLGHQARRGVENNYTYERTAKIWEDHLDTIVHSDHALTWLSPAKIHKPNIEVPPGLSDDEFVRWGMVNIAGRPDLLNSWSALRMVRDLFWQQTNDNTGGIYVNEMATLGLQVHTRPFNRQLATNELLKLCEQRNHWEGLRAQATSVK
jgi:hypothetical protein